MEPPVAPPRRKSLFNTDSTDPEENNSSPFFQNKTMQVIHTAEVHNTVEDTSTNNDENSSIKSKEKRKKKLRRKGTFLVSKQNSPKGKDSDKSNDVIELQSLNGSPEKSRGGETDTVSQASSSPSSSKIKLIPFLGNEKKKKKPSGYATETLSEDSGPEGQEVEPSNFSSPKQRHTEYVNNLEEEKTAEDGQNSEEKMTTVVQVVDNSKEEVVAVEEIVDKKSPSSSSSKRTSPPPVPLPRTSLSKSQEMLIAEKPSIQGSPRSYCTSSSLDYKDTGSLPKQRPKKQKKKRRTKEQNGDTSHSESVDEVESHKSEDSPEKERKKSTVSDVPETFICLTIHNCEPLRLKDFRCKPLVKVTFIDIETGKIKCNSKGEAINPLETQAYDFTCQRSTVPAWNEDLIVMEPLEVIHNSNTVLIIELVDEDKAKIIAWAFLRPVGANGASNSGKLLRLQLFKQGRLCKDMTVPQAYYWWKRKEQTKYKSTLYITLSGIPKNMIVQNIEGEPPKKNDIPNKSPSKSTTDIMTESEDRDLEDVKWGRLPSLSCKLPNKYLARLPAGPDGSIAIAYSHSGLFLASANKVNVSVFTFRGRPYLSLLGHTGLVYSIKWSPNDKYLLSASADFTSCVWDIGKKTVAPIQVVPHPSYVYCSIWLDNMTFATGCFDCDIRIWKIGSATLYQQESKHTGQINSLLSFETTLISGDSSGEIYIWRWNSSGSIQFERELAIREIQGKVINKLSIHPGKKRLLIHTRDSVLRLVDLATGSVLHWFQGLVNTKLREDSTFCGCGSTVLAWSEDSTLCAWDSNTGAQMAIYPGLIPDSRPGVVEFHPRDHMMAVSAHSSQSPTLCILTYDRKSSGREVSLVPLNKQANIGLSTSDLRSVHSDRSTESTPRKKKESLLKALLNRKKTKKDTSSTPSIENSFSDFSRLQGIPRDLDMVDMAAKESRLTDIIKRMDKILISVAHNNGSVYTT